MSKKGKGLSKIDAVVKKVQEPYQPLDVAMASSGDTVTRRNRAATITRTDEFTNIQNGLVPFKFAISKDYKSNMDVRDAVILCQKAYYNFAIFRNTIDLMTEFSTSQIFFKKGSKKSRDFFTGLLSKINAFGLQDRFYREYYRSGNVFIYRLVGEIKDEDLSKMNRVFGTNASKGSKVTIPVRYVILNPADIQVGGNISFSNAAYYKILSDYELERLKNPRTEEDKEVLKQLNPEVIKNIKNKSSSLVLMPLDSSEIVSVFYKKQDYEPFAVPMGYPVLTDINWKAEMKKMDMALTRTMNQVILLITMGAEQEKGGVNPKHIEAMQQFFQNESVARVLIADYTTKAQWAIPDIANLLDPKKYAVVDKDIREGLNNLLVNSDDKFSNASIKIDVFVERLRQAREAFINEFLLPEIKKIAKDVGLKNYPTPYFEDIELKDSLEYAKIYTRLGELGILTPAEVLESIDNGRLPSTEESLENQLEFRKNKDKGLYEPIVGGPFSQGVQQKDGFKNQEKLQTQNIESQEKTENRNIKSQERMKEKELQHISENPNIYKQPPVVAPSVSKPAGRPAGSKSPKKSGKIGGAFSLSKLKDNLILSSSLNELVKTKILEVYKLDKLNDSQKETAEYLSEIIIANESPENWTNCVDGYIKNPLDKNEEVVRKVQEIAAEHQVTEFLASLLYHSRIDNATE